MNTLELVSYWLLFAVAWVALGLVVYLLCRDPRKRPAPRDLYGAPRHVTVSEPWAWPVFPRELAEKIAEREDVAA